MMMMTKKKIGRMRMMSIRMNKMRLMRMRIIMCVGVCSRAHVHMTVQASTLTLTQHLFGGCQASSGHTFPYLTGPVG